jgi:hypothetical protein
MFMFILLMAALCLFMALVTISEFVVLLFDIYKEHATIKAFEKQ